MSMNDTPRAERTHIAFFGKRNVGKSSLVNALTGQEVAVVSPVKGTTTDPVYKAMELLPLGPVVMIDTAGLDDNGDLGEQRIKRTKEVLHKTDLAIIVLESGTAVGDLEIELIRSLKESDIPTFGVWNKIDQHPLGQESLKQYGQLLGIQCCAVSAQTGQGIRELRQTIGEKIPAEEDKFRFLGDLVSAGDLVVLVVPIDKAAPKGRLILPQQQAIRDILESDATAVVTKEHELRATLTQLGRKPRLVITDSQVFHKVAADTPKDIPLTSFSILMARYKGDLTELVRGAKTVERLQDGDKILIAEACTHHQQTDDIGKVKIPRWLRQITGRDLQFEFTHGTQFPENLHTYALVVHCGACMLNRTAMKYRIEQAVAAGVPIVNYGVLISYVQGILERTLKPFPLAAMVWDELGRGGSPEGEKA